VFVEPLAGGRHDQAIDRAFSLVGLHVTPIPSRA
jgi:hypothetical protein